MVNMAGQGTVFCRCGKVLNAWAPVKLGQEQRRLTCCCCTRNNRIIVRTYLNIP